MGGFQRSEDSVVGVQLQHLGAFHITGTRHLAQDLLHLHRDAALAGQGNRMLLQGGVDLDFLDLAVQGLLDLLKQVLVLVGGLLGGFLFLLGLQAQITGVDVLEFLLFVIVHHLQAEFIHILGAQQQVVALAQHQLGVGQLAQAVSVVLALLMLKRRQMPFKITKKDFRVNSQCKRFLTVGIPLALQEFLTQMSFLALCAFINKLGLEASSGYGVACKIVNFAMLIPSALMQSMASFVSQNVGAGKEDRAKKAMFTGMGIGLIVGIIVFASVWFFGDVLTSIFTTDEAVVQKGFEYLKGFAPETILTAILFSMIGYFNGHEKTLWVMIQGLIQTLLVRLPLAYFMSIQPDASLTNIGLAAPVATCFGIILNVIFFIHMIRKMKKV